MKRTKVKEFENFNYRAFLVLASKNTKILDKYNNLFQFTPNVLATIYIDTAFQNRPLNIDEKIKKGIFKIYHQEIADNTDLKKEFDQLSKEYRMFEGKDYRLEILSLKYQMAEEVQKELKRIGKIFTRDCENPIEFMALESTSEIIKIYPDGNVHYSPIGELISVAVLIDDGDIEIFDAAKLVDNLRKIPTPE